MQKFYRILALCLLIVGCHGILTAQQVSGNGTFYTCGSDWARHIDNREVTEATRRSDPEVYNKMVASAQARRGNLPTLAAHASVSTDEIPLEFFLVNQATGKWITVNAVSKYISDKVIVWVDVRDTGTGKVSQSTIDKLVEGVEQKVKAGPTTRDANKGVLENDIDIFGAPPVDEWGVQVHMLLVDIPDSNLTGGTINGYFYPVDQTDKLGSNQKNLLYIDSPPLRGNSVSQNAINTVLGTIAHEFQHLINYRRYQGSGADEETHWIYNEGLSEIASIRNGYIDRMATLFLGAPNQFAYFDAPISETSGSIILPGYERGMLFMFYLWEQFGDDMLYALDGATGPNLSPVQAALQQIHKGDIQAEDVFTNYWIANYLQNADNSLGDARYKYRNSIAGTSAATVRKIIPTAPKTEEQDIKGYAAYLPRYTNASTDINTVNLKVRFLSNSRPYRATAVILRANDVIEVKPLTIDEEVVIEKFSSVTFVINSLTADEQTVKWEVAKGTIGVDDYTTAPGELALTGAVPNPVRGEVRLNFRTAAAAGVNLQLFDMRGVKVQDVIDGDRYESGEHTIPVDVSTLPAGVYTVRLEDASGSLSVRQIVVVK